MKILWVKANKLLPLHSGGDIRSFHILKNLSKHHEITLLSYYDGDRDTKYEQELKDHFPNAISLGTGKSELNFASRSVDYVRRLPESAPYAVSRFASPEVKKQIKTLLESGSFDVAVCDFLDAAINFPDPIQVPTVLFQHNVESEIWRRHAENESHTAKRIVYKMEFKKMLRYEQAEIRKFQQVIAVSENDRGLMQSWAGGVPIVIVPTGVDVRHYSAAGEGEAMGSTVMFIGAMDWEPNIDAAEYFCEHIWETVVKQIPEAKFVIVGRNPGARIRKLISNSVEVTGEVPSILDYLKRASVVVVPLRIGGGTRLKIYEAMAAGKAVVSTTVGAEGLDVTPGVDIKIEDDPENFSRQVIALLRDPELRAVLGCEAAKTARKYDWPAVADAFGQVLESAAKRHAASPMVEVV